MNGTVIYVERIKPTDEEFADVLGVVHTTVQLPGRSCVVDSNLNKCGVRHCHGRSRTPAGTHAHSPLPSRTFRVVEYARITMGGVLFRPKGLYWGVRGGTFGVWLWHLVMWRRGEFGRPKAIELRLRHLWRKGWPGEISWSKEATNCGVCSDSC